MAAEFKRDWRVAQAWSMGYKPNQTKMAAEFQWAEHHVAKGGKRISQTKPAAEFQWEGLHVAKKGWSN